MYFKYLTKGSINGMTLAFFKPGEIIMEYEDRNAEINGNMKYGSYVDISGIHKKLWVTEGKTSGSADT